MWYRPLFKDFVLAWLVLVIIGLWYRPLTPVDETRAVTVAWEMWQRHDFLVPHLNGEPYSHKPPLLQWCIQLLWLIFGVSEWSARLVSPLFGLGNLYLAGALARRLWPDDQRAERIVPWILLAMPIWALWTSLTLYDMMVTFFAQLGMLGIVRAAQGETRMGWVLTGLAIGGGVFAKGPVILLLILPTALFAPWWRDERPVSGWRSWYLGMLGAIGIGAILGLAWAIPAGIAGGEEYRQMIFWGQSAGRIANSFAHKRPLWWYLELLPLLTFPWFWWPSAWRAVRQGAVDAGQRFCLVQMLFIFAVFSLISGKQVHYLLPMYPALALFLARGLGRASSPGRWRQTLIGLLIALPGVIALALPYFGELGSNEVLQMVLHAPELAKWGLIAVGAALAVRSITDQVAAVRVIGLAMLVVLLIAHVGYEQFGRPFYDLQPFADRLAAVAKEGVNIVHWRKYHGDFNFLGRLPQPVREIDDKKSMLSWLEENPNGYVILERKAGRSNQEAGAVFAQFYRGSRRVQLWRVSSIKDQLNQNRSWLD